MIVYLETKAQFWEDILSNRMEEKVIDSFENVLGNTLAGCEREPRKFCASLS